MHDILIEGGTVIDGTGAMGFRRDLAIDGTRIADLLEQRSEKAATVIDASDKVVCPGFIDVHSHSDLSLLAEPLAESKIMQGVTTELIGNCGLSPAPLLGQAREEAILNAEKLGIDIDWVSLEEYFHRLEGVGPSVNVAALIGAGTLRRAAIGTADVKASPEQLDLMRRLLADCIRQGAYGVSSGLIYAPGCYASTEELIALARTSASLGGIYASHIRGEGTTVIPAVEEAIRIGREGSARVQVSHHKVEGKSSWGRAKETVRMIEIARADGVDIAMDAHPYTASSTSFDTILPPWAREGNKDEVLAMIRDPATRERIKNEIGKYTTEWEDNIAECGWEHTNVIGFRKEENRRFENRSVAEIAKLVSKSPADAALDLLIEEDLQLDVVFHDILESDVETVLKHPLTSISSDGTAQSPKGPMGRYAVHPRAYGTFPRVIRRFALQKNIFPLEEALKKMTSMPAERLGFHGRGILAKGYMADVVVFDPKTIRDTATFETPHSFPEGIDTVIVNGVMTVSGGTHTGAQAGQILRHIPPEATNR